MIRFACLTLLLLPLAVFAEPLPNPNAEFRPVNMDEVHLGRQLFYDPVLSGNRSVSCATCHHPRFATSDGVSLGIGDGGSGLGPDRNVSGINPPEQRIPRNAPALFNLGAVEFTAFFHDGRLQEDAGMPSGFRTPLGTEMETGFDSALAAQAMFPVLSGDEMAGHYSENDVAQAVRQGFLTGENGAWALLAARVAAIPDYRASFGAINGNDRPISFADVANAIAAFIEFEWRADQSPFDQFLVKGTPLPDDSVAGMDLFYGKAGCDNCHSGLFQTDHSFHAIAMPQIGPGKAARFERHNRDVGRMRVTGDDADAYRFRTPSLRNVSQTGPYGHAGAYSSLEMTIRHHLDPVAALFAYDPTQASLPGAQDATDFRLLGNLKELEAIAQASELVPSSLEDDEVHQIITFLWSLNDTRSLKGRLGVPETVPSGLPVDQ